VVEDVADLWAMERSNVFKGRYHVLGGTLSALDDIGPEDLHIPAWSTGSPPKASAR
jgi:recombination protein RecR